MPYIAVLFGHVLAFCYHEVINNYIGALLLFTFITKITLLPISFWTQKNSIKMVKMQPILDQIQINFFGDKDKIADETAELYKKEKYNPFAGVIPLVIQIIILLGIIEVVKYPEYAGLTNMEMTVGQIQFYIYPYMTGGMYWYMPFLAGISALVLSLAQNRLNPLQSEQAFSGQTGTTLFSVGISLALGAFVPVGVGFYWICSNLFTVIQQLLLNQIIDPRKYIDHDELRKSREQLEVLQKIGKEKRFSGNQYAARERTDYKRFFSVANKHIVFYSENNGFYKYFENVIEYLLEHSNLIIHYITSDPEDAIFVRAEKSSRIRGYYIGEKRLITLMMKMDADMVVMTMSDLGNYHIKRSYVRKDIEYVYMFHYPLSTHMVLHTGALDYYDTILCVGEFQFAEIRKQEEIYHLPRKKLLLCGYGQLEKLQEAYNGAAEEIHKKRKILIAPSWQEGNILDSCIDSLLTELLGRGSEIVVRPHPEYIKRYGKRMELIINRYQDYHGEDLSFELDFTTNKSIFDSDVVITDWSGTAYEFAFVTGKPPVFLDTPMKVNNPDYIRLGIEPLEISLRNQVGIRLDPKHLEGTYGKLQKLFDEQESYKKKNLELREKYIANYGRSGEAGGRYIISSLKERAQKRKEREK